MNYRNVYKDKKGYKSKTQLRGMTLYKKGQAVIPVGVKIPRKIFKSFSSYRSNELKSVDTTGGDITGDISTTAVITVLNTPLLGSAFYNRIGNKISLQSLQLKLNINLTTGNGLLTINDYARFSIVYDRAPNGSFPTVADVYRDFNLIGAGASNAFSNPNLSNKERFTILMDHHVYLPALRANGVETLNSRPYLNQDFNIFRYIRLNNLDVTFRGSGGGIGDLSTGALLLIVYSANVLPNNAGYNYTGTARVRYYD